MVSPIAKPVSVRRARLPLAISLAAAGLLCTFAGQQALAACTVSGLTATCSGSTVSTFTSNVNNLIVNVDNGATVYSSQGNDMTLGGNNLTFNNNGGTIGPTLLSSLVELTSAVVMGNPNNSTVRITNSGIVRAIGDIQSASTSDLIGVAFEIKNGANGSVTFTNNNTIDSAPLITASGLVAADIPALVIYNPLNAASGAGPKVTFLNAPTAVISGRVAFQGSSQGNTFINGGTLSGSLSMGSGGATANTFIAVTGSLVTAGGGTAVTRGVTGKANLSFAAAGVVDGGLNGAVSGFNTLRLQNNADLNDPGTGSAGSGSISSATYINFPNLRVISGTWTILGPLLGSYATTSVQLTGGVASVNDSQVFGNATVVASGGELRSLDPSVNLANTVTVGPNGLTVSGSSQLTLSGQLTGGGMLTKSGTSTLVLSNASNDYTGGTTLAGGTLSLSNAQAIGFFGLSVTGPSTLQLTAPMELENNITLGSALSVNGGSNTVTLSGDITGTGSLTKLGTGNLILSGANNFSGGLALGGGTVTLGNANVLGSGTISLTADSTLSNNILGVSLGNNVVLGTRALTLNSATDINLSGVVSGTTGRLVKQGVGRLTLNNANTFAGGVSLEGGSLLIGSNNALGSGRLTAAAGTTLDTTAARILTNVVTLGGNATVAGSNDLTLSGSINGAGGLTKNGSATLTLSGNNSYLGGVALNAGTLLVGNNNALGSAALTTAAGTTLGAAGAGVTLNNLVNLNGDLTLNGPNNLSLSNVVSGTGNLIKNGNSIVQLAAANTFQGDTILNAGTLYLSNAGALSQGRLIANAGTIDAISAVAIANGITLNGAMTVGGLSNMTLQGVIEGSGSLVKGGTANLTLTGVNTYTGGTSLNGGTLALGNAGAIGAGDLTVGGNATLFAASAMTLDNAVHLDAGLALAGFNDLTLAGTIDGSGSLTKNGSGALTLSGISTYSGATQVNAGTLNVTGTLASGSVQVNNGATLTGSGSLSGAVTVANGGHLALSSGSQLALGALTLNDTSILDVGLGAPSTGSTALATVGGNLVLDGTLNVSDIGSFGDGVYRLFDYTGALTDNGLVLGTLPVGITADDLLLQTSVGSQVNLVVGGPNNVLFWDGNATASDGTIQGGSGTWDGLGNNWTNEDGTINRNWSGKFAVFQGAAGAVRIDGSQSVTGLQFVTDGYTLEGIGQLQLVNSGGATNLRVGSNVTATLDVALTGSGLLNKQEAGTLVLNGANSYTGGTLLSAGTLVVGNDSALGSGALTAADNTTLDSNSAVTLANAITTQGVLKLGGSDALTLNGVVAGAGSLVKNGPSLLILNGANSYSGGTVINGGDLILGDAQALGSGALSITGNTVLDTNTAITLNQSVAVSGALSLAGNQDLTLAGGLSGNGVLNKQGLADLTLGGVNTFSGALNILAGTLRTTAGTEFASASQLSLGNGTRLVLGGDTRLGQLTGAGSVDIGASALSVAGGSFSGSLSGSGALSKVGSGTLVLSGTSSHTGTTTVSGGSLVVNGGLASSSVLVESGASLGGGGSLSGNVTVADGGSLALTAGSSLGVGSLVLNSGSNLNAALGAASASLPALVAVNGDLTLDGTLNITNIGGFGPGVYQLFTYGGSLVDNGLVYGSLPGTQASDLTLQTAIANQINLVVKDSSLQFWNGSKNAPDGTVGGSDGIWGSDTNWTNASGTSSSDWANAFAVFGGERGTVTVVGQQSFGGLQFLTDGYQLVAGSGGALDVNNATDGSQAVVRVSPNAIATVAAPLVGTGGIEKLDTGTLVLTGANTYTGGTTVTGGTLIGNTTSLQGDIVDEARVVFQQDTSGTFVGTLSGSGALVKQGAGDLLLTGNHSFDGTVELSQGTLTVGNAESDAAAASRLASVARFARFSLFAAPTTTSALNAQINVAQGATLMGTGTVGSVVNNGTVAVGGDTGSLSVTDDFTNAGTGTLAVTLNTTASNYLNIGGTANLAGSLRVIGLGDVTAATQYTLLTAGGGINGTFADDNLKELAFVTASLNYGSNDVTLDVARNAVGFASLARTSNQRQVAQALDDASAPASLRSAILLADTATAAAAFESLSGEIYASTTTVLVEDSRYIRDAVNDRLRQAGCSDAQDPRRALAPTSNAQSTGNGCDGGGTGWIRALGGWGDFDGGHNAANIDRDLSGFLIGFDNNLNDQWRLGVATGYSNSSLKAKGKGQDASVDSYHLTTYLGYQLDAFAARLGAGYTWHDIDSKRSVEAGSYNERLKSSYKARTAQLFGEVGYTLDAGGVALEPFAGLAWVDHDSDKAREKGGAGRLEARSDQTTTFSTVGVRAGKTFTLDNGTTLTPRGSIGWRHAFGDTTPDADLRFIEGGPGFSNEGVAIARDAAVIEAGVDLGIGQRGKLGVGYSGQLASESRDHAVTVSFSLGF